MINLSEALLIHDFLVEKFGGSRGVRDEGALVSAISRPYQTFDGHDLYPSIVEKAASLIESILVNHPFVDGNKRTGYVLMRLLLLKSGHDIQGDEQAKYDFVISIASGKSTWEEIVTWLEAHITTVNGG
jgi:death on curing protein